MQVAIAFDGVVIRVPRWQHIMQLTHRMSCKQPVGCTLDEPSRI